MYLSSVSHSSTGIEIEEEVVETSNLQPTGQKHRDNLSLIMASEGRAVLQDGALDLLYVMLSAWRQCQN